MPDSPRVLVIGAGITGLTAAWLLKQRGLDIRLIEKARSPGGAARSLSRDGFLLETGPNTFMVSEPGTVSFLESCGLWGETLDAAPEAKNRFLVNARGRVVPMPSSLGGLVTTDLLSLWGKIEAACEPILPRGTDPNETLASFFTRRFGREVFREFVDPFVSGIFAGDPQRLVVRHALPKIHQLESEHRSLVAGLFRARRAGASRPRRRLISWASGLGHLAERLGHDLRDRLVLGCGIESLGRNGAGFEARGAAGERFEADLVALTVPAGEAARLIEPLCPAAETLRTVPYAPVVVAHLGFERGAVGHPLNGFGVLISRARGRHTLGALFSSTLFPHRAPDGMILLTAFLGGAREPGVVHWDDKQILGTVMFDLAPLLRIEGMPTFTHLVRWPTGIPQYNAGHDHILDQCRAVEDALPGLWLAGNYRGGVSLEACLNAGQNLATQIESHPTATGGQVDGSRGGGVEGWTGRRETEEGRG